MTRVLLLLLALIPASLADTVYDCGPTEKLEHGRCVACPKCPVGTGLDKHCGFGDGGGLECRPCGEGLYNDNPADHLCIQCTDCTRYGREYKYQCRPSINAECGACLPGYYDSHKNLLHRDPLYICVQCTPHSVDPQCTGLEGVHTTGPNGVHQNTGSPADPLPVWKPVIVTLAVVVIVLTAVLLSLMVYRKRKKAGRAPCCRLCVQYLCRIWESNCCKRHSRRERSTDSSHDEESLFTEPNHLKQVERIPLKNTALELKVVPNEEAENDDGSDVQPETSSSTTAKPSLTRETVMLNNNIIKPSTSQVQHVQCGLFETDNRNVGTSFKSLDHKMKTIPYGGGLQKARPPRVVHCEISQADVQALDQQFSETENVFDGQLSIGTSSNGSSVRLPSIFEVPDDIDDDEISSDPSMSFLSQYSIDETPTLLIRGDIAQSASDEVDEFHLTYHAPPVRLNTIAEEGSIYSHNQDRAPSPLYTRRINNNLNATNASPVPRATKDVVNITSQSSEDANVQSLRSLSELGELSLTLGPQNIPQPSASAAPQRIQVAPQKQIKTVGNPTSIVFNDGGVSIHVINNYPAKDTNTEVLDLSSLTDTTSQTQPDPSQTCVKTPVTPLSSPKSSPTRPVLARCRPLDSSWLVPVQETCDGPSQAPHSME